MLNSGGPEREVFIISSDFLNEPFFWRFRKNVLGNGDPPIDFPAGSGIEPIVLRCATYRGLETDGEVLRRTAMAPGWP